MSLDRRFLPFAVWSGLVAFFLPTALFFETFILLSDEVAHSQTLLMPVYWLLCCGVPIFLIAILLFSCSRIAANLFLAITITFSFTYLKLEYISAYSQTGDFKRLLFQLAAFGLLSFLFIRFEYTKSYPSKALTATLLLVFVAIPYFSRNSDKEPSNSNIDKTEMVGTNEKAVDPNKAPNPIKSVKDINFEEKPNFYLFL